MPLPGVTLMPPGTGSSLLSVDGALMVTRSSAPSRISGGGGGSGSGSSFGGRSCASAQHAAADSNRKRTRRMGRFYSTRIPRRFMADTLLLVDGSSYLYRAFHALPELKSP